MSAVEGGHINDIAAANAEIRAIVEARNEARATVADTEIAEEIKEELKKASDLSKVEPLTGVFDEENPKDTVGSGKIPLSIRPATANAMTCLALYNGALKYGRYNWRVKGVRVSVYLDALMRHIAKFNDDGEWADEEGIPHLAAASACLDILMDAFAVGVIKDDRPIPGAYSKVSEDLTPLVRRLQAEHADKHPHHYTIGDR